MTFYGALCIGIAGALQALGWGQWAEIIKQIAAVLGIPLTTYGIARKVEALRK